jgi:WD40 repeat protein
MNALISLVSVFLLPAFDIEPRVTLEGHRGWVEHVAFSADGKILASGCREGSIRVWDVTKPEAKTSFQWPTGTLCGVALSPDGKLLAAAGGYNGGAVRLWGAASGRELAALKGLPKQARYSRI